MKSKILGRTGLVVPALGLGAAFVGKDPKTGEIDEALGISTVVTALEAGCTWIDTAPLYGKTKSESIIGKALQSRPDLDKDIVVTTKVGVRAEGKDYRYDAVMRSVEASQQRLGRDRFEILYVHDAMDIPKERILGKGGALDALRKLQDEKVVRFVGTATNDPVDNAPFIETGEFDVALVPDAWSLINQQAQSLIFPAAEKHNVGIVLATPLERGLLATGPGVKSNYLNRNFTPELLAHVGKIQTLCRQHNIPLISTALSWCVRHPRVALALTGPRKPEEAKQNFSAMELKIPEPFWEELEPLVLDWTDTGYLISPTLS